MKKLALLLVLSLAMMLSACKMEKETVSEEKTPVEYAVVKYAELPKEVAEYIDQNKTKAFKTTYTVEDYLYILVSYGEMNTSGYSIVVDEIFETDKVVQIKTKLVGPFEGENVNQVKSYPYVVVKMENVKKNVVFK